MVGINVNLFEKTLILRNIFDQYSQYENKLTHCLLSCLSEDKNLLEGFLKTFYKKKTPPIKDLIVDEQRLPDGEEISEKEAGKRGLPDGLIYDGKGWVLVFESKVSSPLDEDQLGRHFRALRNRGYSNLNGITIDTENSKNTISGWQSITWCEIYIWAKKFKGSENWANQLAEYFEVIEKQMVDDEYLKKGSITEFYGIPFNEDNPCAYLEAKRILKILEKKLRSNKMLEKELNVDFSRPGRSFIQKQLPVWDIIHLKTSKNSSSSTSNPHLTYGIGSEALHAFLTIPDRVGGKIRKTFKGMTLEEFSSLIWEVASNMWKSFGKEDGVKPQVRIVQRRYRSRTVFIVDCEMNFDLRTSFPKFSEGVIPKIKPQIG